MFVNQENVRGAVRGGLITILGLVIGYHLLFLSRVYPGVKVAGIDLGGKTHDQAKAILEENVSPPSEIMLTLGDASFPIELATLNFSYDFEKTAEAAGSLGRSKNLLVSLRKRLQLLLSPENLPLSFRINQEALEQEIAAISEQVSVPALEPTVSVQKGEIIVYEGKDGKELEARLLKQAIVHRLSYLEKGVQELPIREITPSLTEEEVQALKAQAEKLLGKKLVLKFERDSFSYPDEQLVGLLGPDGKIDKLKISTLAANIADGVNREAQNATFVFRDGRVREFTPAKDGVRVREDKLTEEVAGKLVELMEGGEKAVALQIPVATTEPEITTEEVNDLGIKELLGRGNSTFRGSILSRVHNIGLSASRINGALVRPGEVFSFNRTLGDISVYAGYQQAYVISGGRTILGDGGGVCQTSTTFFRAALDAGLPIVERHQHSYRVSYYEQDSKPGIDATIYVPTIDLKVKNDTPGHILIQSYFDPKISSLVFEIYGTDDGREVTVSTPRVWDVKAPPPALYQDDPTLPAGTVKQVDFAAWGAKAAFDYKVVRGDEVLQDRTFYSNFRPWQAVYLRGTGP